MLKKKWRAYQSVVWIGFRNVGRCSDFNSLLQEVRRWFDSGNIIRSDKPSILHYNNCDG